ncbi:MAG: group 1 glycosyl transferase, partial [Actinobacteria bacterium]|nr:group 1 glycosyl transferase [Actinomycetota bacterium]
MGGLHHHVLASVRAMHAANHEVIVVSKPGPFADAISGLGAAHISTDWSDEGI